MKHLLWLALPIVFLFAGCEEDQPNQFETNRQLIEAYLEENQLTAREHSSGLFYIIDEPGSGGSPNVNSEVLVNYKGYLLDGSVFDETYGTPRTFFLRQVIQGWQIGIPLLQKGGKGRFFIPSYLAYGATSRPGIPPNSILIFETELINFQ